MIARFRASIRETFYARASEWALAAMMMNLSIILFVNDQLFLSSAYSALAAIAPQSTWGWGCFLLGGTRLSVLAVNGALRRSPHLRAMTAFISCFFWFQMTIGTALSEPWATGLAIYPVLLLLDSYNVIRAMGEAGISDWQARERVLRNDDRT